MKVVSLVGRKGGTGKTTLAIQLAVAAHHAGFRTTLVAADDVGAGARWAGRRSLPRLAVVQPGDTPLPALLGALRRAGGELAVIDTGPTDDALILAAARAADLSIAPCAPGVLGMEPCEEFFGELAGSVTHRPVCLALNLASSALVAQNEMSSLALRGLPCAPVPLAMRVAYQDAAILGLGVQEFEPHGPAAGEVLALVPWVLGRLGLPARITGDSL